MIPYRYAFSALAAHIQSIIIAGGYPFLFLAVFLEGLPLVGTVVPGHVAIIAAGFLAKVGVLDLYWVLALSVVGAVLGDFMGFYLGRKYGLTLIDRLRPYFFISDAQLDKANRLLAQHTGKAMVIGRFSPMTRALMPFLVGASEVPARRFWTFNLIGAASWTGISVMVGYAFGASFQATSGLFGGFVVAAIILALLFIWGYRFVNMRFHVFRRYELFILGLNLISLYALARTIQDALSARSFLAGFDIWVNLFMASHVTPLLAAIAASVSAYGSFVVTGSIGIAIAVILACRHRFRSSFIMLLSVSSTSFLVGFMKEFFMRLRPENELQHLSDYSFPSAHAAMAAAFFLIVAYLLAPRIRSWVWRELMVVAAVLAVIAIGLSRVVLNVHWASDVIAGWSLGIFCGTASILLVRYAGTLFIRKVTGGSLPKSPEPSIPDMNVS